MTAPSVPAAPAESSPRTPVWRDRWVAISLMVVAFFLGATLVALGFLVDSDHLAGFGGGDYLPSVLLEIGAAFFLIVPLVILERVINRTIGEANQHQADLHKEVATKVEEVQQDVQDARTRIDELDAALARQMASMRAADVDALQGLHADVSESNTWSLLCRARDLGAVEARGVRIRLPDCDLRVRFAPMPSAHDRKAGSVRLSFEGADGEEIAAPEDWSPDEPAHHALARLAENLQRAGVYPGDRSFNAVAIFEGLIELLGTVIARRTGERDGAHLGPIIELTGPWAITTHGLEHVDDDRRAVESTLLLRSRETAHTALLAGRPDVDQSLVDALEAAVQYHSGEHRRAARRRVPTAHS